MMEYQHVVREEMNEAQQYASVNIKRAVVTYAKMQRFLKETQAREDNNRMGTLVPEPTAVEIFADFPTMQQIEHIITREGLVCLVAGHCFACSDVA